jgi:hypothetical protein
MKNLFIFCLFVSLLALLSCLKDKCTETQSYIYYKPVYVTPEEYKIPVSLSPSRTLNEPGKIYFYKNYIFINELRKGIHVINNENPKQPVNEGFITIPGNVDMAVMNNKLYVDSYTDLLVIDLDNPLIPKLTERKENIFDSFYFADGSNRILSHYEKTEFTQTLDCSSSEYGKYYYYETDGDVFISTRFGENQTLNSGANGTPQIGKGGSMARFTISHQHLYAVGNAEIYSLPIQPDGTTGQPNVISLPWGIETIFPFKNYLFLGANNGMHIMELIDPANPVLRSSFTHARACDPVVVDDDIAFVTLRTGENVCPGDKNELQVIDVNDIYNPRLLHTFPMQNPHGLGFWNNHLYICEGKHGLKVFDKSDLASIGKNLKGKVTDYMAWDVIAIRHNLLLMIGEDGFYQFDCSDPAQIKLLSKIGVVK